jgi:hypothetical protein
MTNATWNVTTLKNSDHIEVLTNEFRRFELDIRSFKKSYPRGRKKKLGNIEIIYSGRKDGVHGQGVGLVMNKEAAVLFRLGGFY